MTKNLKELFTDFPVRYTPKSLPSLEISEIVIDSRRAKRGDLFVAMRGGALDGHDYIVEAVNHGAAAVIGDQDLSGKTIGVPYIQVRDTREVLTWLAAAYYEWPARKLTVIGVTGTDGKTTTTNMIFAILKAAGIRSGMVSTVNAVIGEELLDTGFHVTTPDAHDLQGYLDKMVKTGLTHAVLEVTSHGLAQHRVDACEFDIGVVTNITHEHLDQHGSYENYRAAKARLFTSLEKTLPKSHGNNRLAVINRDDQSYEFLGRFIKVDWISYGLSPSADVYAEDVLLTTEGMSFTACSKSRNTRTQVSTHLMGVHNVSNCLAAITTAVDGLKLSPEVAAKGISNLEAVPGRMEKIEMGQDFIAMVDFAHTPNSLKVTLETGRKILDHSLSGIKTSGGNFDVKQKRIIAVFGSAGLRDKEKRRLMAEISTLLADLTILTAEDPRTESLDQILEEMAAGARSKGGREGVTFWRVPDRGEAVRLAIKMAKPGDLVLSCGKGHEQSMCFGKREHPWDDRIAIRAALAEHLNVPGPAMPYLPTQDTTEEDWLAWI
jgi:UDP-N-acetylmuramoyl-L-alanyl-D-glutamate--2,6-diaminopimelate ligase